MRSVRLNIFPSGVLYTADVERHLAVGETVRFILPGYDDMYVRIVENQTGTRSYGCTRCPFYGTFGCPKDANRAFIICPPFAEFVTIGSEMEDL